MVARRRATVVALTRAVFAAAFVLVWSPALNADVGGLDLPETSLPVAESPAHNAAIPATMVYQWRIEGVENEALRSVLERGSQLAALVDRPPASEAGLWRRIEEDRRRFDTILRSEGYYDGSITARIDQATAPPTVIVDIDPGPVFRFRSFAIEEVGNEASELVLPTLSDLGIIIGARARGIDVLNAETKLVEFYGNNAHPLAVASDRKAIVDFADQSMEVVVQLDPGPKLAFGPLTIEGLNEVEEDYVRMLVPWAAGDPFDQQELQQFRRRLIRSGLFSAIVITEDEAPTEDGQLPVSLVLVESKMRSIGAGAKYYTSEGPAVELFWEHRNAFGRNEDLAVSTEIGRILQNLKLSILIPDYNRFGQDLLGSAEALRETTDAFDKLGVETSARIRRRFGEIWTIGSGPSLETAWIEERGDERENSTLLGLPSYVFRDTTDSPLNPTEGTRVRYGPTPYVGWYTQRQVFISNELSGSGYIRLDPSSRYVLAARTKVGSLVGQARRNIPPDKRFYAGGGSSIRGYPFQKVGPLDNNNDPIGGRSLLELSGEFRARVWGNFGLAP
ncbi:MAG: BamA/TamA family outer membrane protein, partial [Rhodospirillales bacterium]|nr:BamA/TamA family outer membrane protein [Rhodospirillales bacterium]